MIKALWDFRGFIFCSVARDLQKAYLGKALLGRLLILIRPLALVAVYTIIFSTIMENRNPQIYDALSYTIYLCTGIFCWFYFTEVINKTTVVFLENANLIKKHYLPRSSLPIIVFLTSTINFAVILFVFLMFLLIKNRLPGWDLLGIIPLLLIQQLLAVGLGIILGTLNVFFRDIQELFPVLLQCWFWMTPIVYPIEIIPDRFRFIIETWNPMYPVMEGYHKLFLGGNLPEWDSFLFPGILGLGFVTAGYFLFRSLSCDLVDEL